MANLFLPRSLDYAIIFDLFQFFFLVIVPVLRRPPAPVFFMQRGNNICSFPGRNADTTRVWLETRWIRRDWTWSLSGCHYAISTSDGRHRDIDTESMAVICVDTGWGTKNLPVHASRSVSLGQVTTCIYNTIVGGLRSMAQLDRCPHNGNQR